MLCDDDDDSARNKKEEVGGGGEGGGGGGGVRVLMTGRRRRRRRCSRTGEGASRECIAEYCSGTVDWEVVEVEKFSVAGSSVTAGR